MNTRQLFINGAFTPSASGKTGTITNPANGEAVGEVSLAGAEDATRAIAAARDAFDNGPWPRMPHRERLAKLRHLAALLKERETELMPLESAQAGIPIRKTTLMDIPVGIDMFTTMLDLADMPMQEPLPFTDFPKTSWNFLNRHPVGVCAAIAAWNYPWLFTIWKAAPALAMGNTLVFKPAALTPLTAGVFAECVQQADFPPGVFNYIPGPGAEVGQALCQSPLVDKISFTGSTAVGREIQRMSADNIKRLTLELGGKSPMIVLDDAWLDITVDTVLFAVFFNSGQSCEAGTRLLLQKGIYPKFMDRLLDRIKLVKPGPTDDFETTLGPLITEEQRARVEGYIESGRQDGATLACGGGRPAGLDKGFYVEPTVFTDVTPEMKIFQEEIFGPVLTVTRFDTESEAVALANNSIYGLAGAVFTASIPKGVALAKRIRSGTVWVNDYHLLNGLFPFGGFKQSGVGREMGLESLRQYTEAQHIHVDQVGDDREEKFWLDYVINDE